MLRVLALPAVCLVLCGSAAAQDRSGPATPNPPERAQPVPVNEPEQTASTVPSGPVGDRAEIAGSALRGSDPGASRTVAALKAPSGGPRPWCAQERRVGTGLGFCLIN